MVVTDTEVNNCTRTGSVTVDIQSDFLFGGTVIEPELCPGEVTDVELLGSYADGTNFTWNIGDANFIGGDSTTTGVFQLSWDEPGDKIFTVALQQGNCNDIIVELETTVFPIIGTPIVSCPVLPSDSTFTWTPVDGAISYTVTVLVGGVEVESFNTPNSEYTVEGALGEEVEVTVLANHGFAYCDGVVGSATCEILGCELPADFGILTLNDVYCVENDAVTLIANPPGGVFTLGEDEITSFDPSQGEGEYIIEYTFEDIALGCIFITSDTTTVLGAITADFIIPDSVCVGEIALIDYTGNAGADANYDWTFSGSTPPNFIASDSVEVSWDNPGSFPVILVVDANGCDSGPPVPQIITVVPTPIAPELTCDEAGLGEASISWTAEANHLYFIEAFINGNSIPVISPITEGNYSANWFRRWRHPYAQCLCRN